MLFDHFIQLCRAEWPEFDDPPKLSKSLHPGNRDLAKVLTRVPGMATENKLKLLNLAVASLEEGESYVEVGCYKGATLVGAAIGNPTKRLFGCDNFSQFDGAAASLRHVLAAHTAPGQVLFYDMDFREFLRRGPFRPNTIGAYFYDGGHSFRDQYHGLSEVLPHLSPDAIVVIDDTNKRAARAANEMIAKCVPGLDLVLDIRTPRNHHPTWWNGIQMFRFRRAEETGARRPSNIGYLARKFVYDDIFLNLKHKRRSF